MKKKLYTIKSKDGSKLVYYSWLPNKQIKLAIGIIHGLGEYSNRYDDFAKYFCKRGYGVYSIDLRGHGNSRQLNYNYDRNFLTRRCAFYVIN